MRRVLLFLMCVSILFCVAGCGKIDFGTPNPPAAQSQVAFLRAPSGLTAQNAVAVPPGDNKIMMMNADGTGAVQFGSTSDYAAVDVSHDGTKVVAIAYDTELGMQLLVISNSGSTVQNITPEGTIPQFPEFSPDGSKIYFVNYSSFSDWEIWSINADGTGATNLGQAGISMHEVTVAPNGKLYFYGQSEGSGIFAMNADGTGLSVVVNNEWTAHPAVSADGTKLIYEDNGDGAFIMSANIDGTSPVSLTSTGQDGDPMIVGDKILFVSTRDGNPELYSMDLNGTNQTRLTNNLVADWFGDLYTPW